MSRLSTRVRSEQHEQTRIECDGSLARMASISGQLSSDDYSVNQYSACRILITMYNVNLSADMR
jgi:hypothetical protein